MRLKTLMPLLAVASLAATGLPAFEFKPMLQADLRAGHEDQAATATDNFAWDGQLFFLPAFQWGSDNNFLPLFAYLRQDADAVIEEGAFFTEQDSFIARPLYRRHLDGAWDLKVWGDARRTVTQESLGQAWSEGLYDYDEFGGGVGTVWKPHGARLDSLDLGLELLHRGYMNWHELPALVTALGKDYYDKDYVGYKLALALDGAKQGAWTWVASLNYLDRDYTDALVETEQGVHDGDSARRDHYGYLDARLSRAEGDWLLDLTLDAAGNLSNENSLDISPSHPQFMPGYYDYLQEQVGAALTFAPHGAEGPSLSAQASILNRNYTGPNDGGRNIQNPDGSYAQGKENDVEERYHFDGRWPLGWRMALVANLDETIAQSNQYAHGAYDPSYDLFQVMAGLQYKL